MKQKLFKSKVLGITVGDSAQSNHIKIVLNFDKAEKVRFNDIDLKKEFKAVEKESAEVSKSKEPIKGRLRIAFQV